MSVSESGLLDIAAGERQAVVAVQEIYGAYKADPSIMEISLDQFSLQG
jgi:hypothetical protein